MKLFHTSLIVLLGCSVLAGCGGDSGSNASGENTLNIDQEINITEEKAEDIVRGLTDAMNQLGSKVETVAAKDLKELMPVEIPGMTRTAYSASKKGIEGFSFSSASATFKEDDGSGVLDLSITDIGNVKGLAQFGLDMLNIEIDEENQDGFQRTGDYKGFKSFQSSTKTRSGANSEMTVFVGDRMVLKAEGRNIDWELIEDVVDTIPVKKLADLGK
ncbi:MAG: hypothetical protein AB8G18_17785 [Gammaproteobacteria bacterium]